MNKNGNFVTWNDIEEAEPKLGERVLVTIETKGRKLVTIIRWCSNPATGAARVTAWLPLPKAFDKAEARKAGEGGHVAPAESIGEKVSRMLENMVENACVESEENE